MGSPKNIKKAFLALGLLAAVFAGANLFAVAHGDTITCAGQETCIGTCGGGYTCGAPIGSGATCSCPAPEIASCDLALPGSAAGPGSFLCRPSCIGSESYCQDADVCGCLSGSLLANGSAGSVTIPYNTAATLSWNISESGGSSSGGMNCNLTSFGSVPASSAGVSTPNLTTSQTYTLSCSPVYANTGGNMVLSVTVNVANPAPTLTSISPNSALMGSSAFTLTLTGTNFLPSSVVDWNGAAQATTYISATQLTASITPADLATAGIIPVAVVSPGPGGGTSGVVNFTVTNPAPTLTSLSPSAADYASGAFTLTVNGTNFLSGAVVNWNGSGLATTFVSATQLTATVPAVDVATAGPFPVTVTNPGPATSGPLNFTVNTPEAIALSPGLLSFVANCIAPPSSTIGTIVVNSTNAVTGGFVTSTWVFTAYPSVSPCSTGPCTGASVTYANQPVVGAGSVYSLQVNMGSAGTLFAMKSMRDDNVNSPEDNSGMLSLDFWKDILVETAHAITIGPCGGVFCPATLPANGIIVFNIQWDPIASMTVSPATVNMTVPAQGAFTISNTGAQGSVLTWSVSSITYSSGTGWLSLATPNPIAAGASQPVAVTYAGTLPPGSYSATVNLSGTSAPGPAPGGFFLKAITVNVTIPATAVPPPVCAPASQIVSVNQAANFTVANGTAPYTWTAPSGAPAGPATGAAFSTKYATTGVDTVTVTDANLNASVCSVSVVNLNCSFAASPTQIILPETSTLSWACTNATACSIDNGVGSVNPISGTAGVAPTSTTNYTLSCTGAGSATYTTNVTVAVTLPLHECNPGIGGSTVNCPGQ